MVGQAFDPMDDDHAARPEAEPRIDPPAEDAEAAELRFKLRSGAQGAIFGKTMTSAALPAGGAMVVLSILTTGPRRTNAQATWHVDGSDDGVYWRTIGDPLRTFGIGVVESVSRPALCALVRVRLQQDWIDPRVTYHATLKFRNEETARADGANG